MTVKGYNMQYENIIYSNSDSIATITLSRPEKLNSFNVAMHLELQDALAKIKADKSIRVLLLTGSGRGFCAGQDLSDRAGGSGLPIDLGLTVKKYYAPLVLALRQLPLPVICGVNGVAAGAGANIALACDIVIAAKSASFIEVFCKIGLMPDTGGTYFLPRLVGSARAMAMSLLGDKITATQAAEWGLIWKCVDDAALQDELSTLTKNFANAPTRGMAYTKAAIYQSTNNNLEQQLELEGDYMRILGNSHDYKEGVAAFLEKRSPKFTGE